MLNKTKGNMYSFVTNTWNPIKGKCSHDCKYCYMKVWKQKPLRLVEKELKDNLGENNFIFVGSSTDVFARDVPYEWIKIVLAKCRNFDGNTYLFQTKDPSRFWKFIGQYPSKSVFGITLETNREDKFHKAISRKARISWMVDDSFMKRKMVTIEPIMDFDLEPFIKMIKKINPEWVNIGADSKNHKLPEPSPDKIKKLINELKKFTKVKIKDNLKRLSKNV